MKRVIGLVLAVMGVAGWGFAQELGGGGEGARGLHVAGLSAYAEGRSGEALSILSDAMSAAGEGADRSLVNNLAAMQLESGNAGDAVRTIRGYLARHREGTDEALLNAMGIALVQARNGSGSKEMEAAGSFYMDRVARLEKGRPGMRRWGVEWVTAEEFGKRSAGGVPEYPSSIGMMVIGESSAVSDGTAPATGVAVEGSSDRTEVLEPRRSARRVRHGLAVPVGPELLLTPAGCVEGATEVSIQSAEGEVFGASVARLDRSKGLALLRIKGVKLHYLELAEAAGSGPAECTAVTEVNLFGMQPTIVKAEVEALSPEQGGWRVRMKGSSLLPGAPLLRQGKMIGVVCEGGKNPDEAAAEQESPAIAVEAIRGFLGRDFPQAPGRFKLKAEMSVYQVIATGGG